MNSPTDSKKIVLDNVLDMFFDRKLLSKEKYGEYQKLFNSKLLDDEFKIKSTDNKVYEIIFLKNIIKKQQVLKIIEDSTKNYVLIIMDPKIAKYFKDVRNIEYVEVFSEFQLLINPTKNIYLSQEHILLNNEEKADLLEEYDCTLSELPKILIDDPITKYFNANVDDIFKIIRNNPITNKEIVYRVVIDTAI